MLYLTGGTNEAACLYTSDGFGRAIDPAAWQLRFALRRASVEETGSAFAQLIVPEKLTIYPFDEQDLVRVFPDTDKKGILPPGRRLLQLIDGDGVVYPDQYLIGQRLEYPIYLPTDSHWTWEGAFSAFQSLMWRLKYKVDYSSFITLPQTKLTYHGDLWGPEFDDLPPDVFTRIVVPTSIQRVYANPIVGVKERLALGDEPGLHAGSHCIFVNESAQLQKTAVIFGSSFSECRLEVSLLTFIFAFYFRSVHFIWSTSVDVEYVRRHKADCTVAEIPERFLTLCPTDNDSVEEVAMDKLDAWSRNHSEL